MRNKYFPEETISYNDLFFVCSMIERVARQLHQRNRYVVNTMGAEAFAHELSCAVTSHCENPVKVAADWIAKYKLERGDFDILAVDPRLVLTPPTETQMGGVYARLVRDTAPKAEPENEGIVRVYNAPICTVIDNYNASAYYEPSYWLAKAYQLDA